MTILMLLCQHDALLNTAEEALKRRNPSDQTEPCVLVFYTHHRPHLAHRDMQFFEKARTRNWSCEEILTEKFPVGHSMLFHPSLTDFYAGIAHVPRRVW